MDRVELYRIWAPLNSAWSPWAKPVLFAADPVTADAEVTAKVRPMLESLGSLGSGTTFVLDLAGAAAVDAGLSLADRYGVRPVPLFNAAIPPDGAAPVVPTHEIRQQLSRAAAVLAKLELSPTAPPAFLLDANRRAPGVHKVLETFFDNRSAVFASDLPSARILREHGIHRCIIVRDARIAATPDLGYALLPWKKADIEMKCCDLNGVPLALDWPPDGLWDTLVHRVSLLLQLKANPAGGYGGFVPESSGG